MPSALALVVCLAVGAALGPEPPLTPPVEARAPAVTWALFAAGAVTGFVAHESGHLLANALLGNRPHITPVWGFGFVPFFAISPELRCDRTHCLNAAGRPFRPGPRGKFAIVTAGFEVQHIASEILLTQDPMLRRHRAPWRKGWLAFNLALSLGYGVASALHIEDSHGDAGGAALLLGVPRPLMAAYLIAPAAADFYRYLHGDDAWAPWVSRGLKVGFMSLAWTF